MYGGLYNELFYAIASIFFPAYAYILLNFSGSLSTPKCTNN